MVLAFAASTLAHAQSLTPAEAILTDAVAAGNAAARFAAKPGTGSAYAYAARDSQGRYLDGGNFDKSWKPGDFAEVKG